MRLMGIEDQELTHELAAMLARDAFWSARWAKRRGQAVVSFAAMAVEALAIADPVALERHVDRHRVRGLAEGTCSLHVVRAYELLAEALERRGKPRCKSALSRARAYTDLDAVHLDSVADVLAVSVDAEPQPSEAMSLRFILSYIADELEWPTAPLVRTHVVWAMGCVGELGGSARALGASLGRLADAILAIPHFAKSTRRAVTDILGDAMLAADAA